MASRADLPPQAPTAQAIPFWGGLCLAPDPLDAAFGDQVAQAAWTEGLMAHRLLPGAYARLARLAQLKGQQQPAPLRALEWRLRAGQALLSPLGLAEVAAGARVALAGPAERELAKRCLLSLGLAESEVARLDFEVAGGGPSAPGPLADLLRREALLGHGQPLPELLPLREWAGSAAPGQAPAEAEALRLGGAVLGPILALFADWMLAQCRRAGIRQLAPLLREGRVLAAFLARAAAARGQELQLLPLHVSRRATLAVRAQGDLRAWLAMILEARGLRLEDLFALLGLSPEDPELAGHGQTLVRAAAGVTLSSGLDLLRALWQWLEAAPVQKRLAERMALEREGLRGYLAQTLPASVPWATLDSGCRGTINAALELALPSGVDRPAHFLLIGTDATSDLVLAGLDIRGFLAGSGGCLDLARLYARSTDVVEQLLMEAEGTTLGYEQAGSAWAPVLGTCSSGPAEAQWKNECRAGAQRFQEVWLAASSSNPAALEGYLERRPELGVLLARLLLLPTGQEADRLGALGTDENAGANMVAPICDAASAQALIRLGPERFLEASRFAYEPSHARWPQGTLARQDPGYALRRLLHDRQAFPTLTGQGWFEGAYQEAIERLLAGSGPVCIYGAGPVGRSFLAAAQGSGLAIAGFTDSNPARHGQTLAGLPIWSLAESLAHCGRFVAASFEHGPAMAATIAAEATRQGRVVVVERLGQGAPFAESEA